MLLNRNERVLLSNGIFSTPFPLVSGTEKSLKKIDQWLHDNSLISTENEFNQYKHDLILSINPKKMTSAERDFLNSIIFPEE